MRFDVTAPTFIGRKSHRSSAFPGKALDPGGSVPVVEPMALKPGLLTANVELNDRVHTRSPSVKLPLSKSPPPVASLPSTAWTWMSTCCAVAGAAQDSAVMAATTMRRDVRSGDMAHLAFANGPNAPATAA